MRTDVGDYERYAVAFMYSSRVKPGDADLELARSLGRDLQAFGATVAAAEEKLAAGRHTYSLDEEGVCLRQVRQAVRELYQKMKDCVLSEDLTRADEWLRRPRC
ncbi:MAG: hypothetical protein PVF27_00850 [Gemmatimonadales bacterium]